MNPSAIVVGMSSGRRPHHRSIVPFVASILFVLLSLTGRSQLFAQEQVVSREEDSLVYAATRLIDAGEFERARQILHDGEKRFPGNGRFPYELAYMLYMEKKYQECQSVMLKIMDSPDVSDRFFQLLGNTYDMLGNPSEAIATYERGLRRFPSSGPLHLERGMMSLTSDPGESMQYWEKGIEREPSFSSNYLYAARQWFRSNNPGWGHIYGEIFLNMEPTGNRADLMREELVESLLGSMTTERSSSGDTVTIVAKISLFDALPVTIDSATSTPLFPFEFFYSRDMFLAAMPVLNESTEPLTIAELHRIRATFLDRWFRNTTVSDRFPTALFDRLKALREAGLFEAYNYWMFRSKATQQEAAAWWRAHPSKSGELLAWMGENRIPTTRATVFARPLLKGIPLPKGDDGGLGE